MTKTKQLLYLFPPRRLLQITLVTITSVRNGTALICTFLPDLLNWSSFDNSKGNFRADAPKCDNGSSALGNPVSLRSEKHGKPIKVWYWDSIQFWVSYQSNGLPSFVKKEKLNRGFTRMKYYCFVFYSNLRVLLSEFSSSSHKDKYSKTDFLR